MKFIKNLYSRFIGWRFAKSWNTSNDAPKTLALLDRYIELRQGLPTVSVLRRGKRFSAHWGNHYGSDKLPFRATQGL
jgi:hypothetical protein